MSHDDQLFYLFIGVYASEKHCVYTYTHIYTCRDAVLSIVSGIPWDLKADRLGIKWTTIVLAVSFF